MVMGTDWGFGWGGLWFGWFMMIGFTTAVVLVVVWLVKLFSVDKATMRSPPIKKGA